jgi:hypothetical protein
MNDTQPAAPADRVECPAAKDPAVRLFIAAAMALAFGGWMVYDHYVSGKYPYSDPSDLNKYASYLFNHFGPFILLPLGLGLAVGGIVTLRRVLVAEADGIGYRGQTQRPWGGIASVDASRLQSKGILVLHFTAGAKLVLDSWKLTNFRNLVAFVEAHLPPHATTGV